MATCMVGGRGALSVCVDFLMVVTIGGCGISVENCMIWRRNVLFVYVDVLLMVTTVCVEACMVWGHGALSACVDFSLVSTTGGCTESIIVVVSIVTTMG